MCGRCISEAVRNNGGRAGHQLVLQAVDTWGVSSDVLRLRDPLPFGVAALRARAWIDGRTGGYLEDRRIRRQARQCGPRTWA
jgi:hypothetical protein